MACGGTRRVARPADEKGYRPVELRDVAPTGVKDANVEVVAFVAASGVGAFEPCDLVSIDTLSAPPPTSADTASVAAFTASMSSADIVTLTLPRSRYSEVRDLHAFQKVRARGYLSDYWGQGCTYYTTDAHRYLWVDSLEPVAEP
jgi:hypothetical protein